MSEAPAIDVTEARRRVADDGWLLLDVRNPAEWQAGHAPEATHVPMQQVPETPPADGARVAAICKSGARSGRVTEFLLQQGFEAVNVRGGMEAWAAAGYPVVTDEGTPGRVA
jgi:rhodanese-related sulfurtransferase